MKSEEGEELFLRKILKGKYEGFQTYEERIKAYRLRFFSKIPEGSKLNEILEVYRENSPESNLCNTNQSELNSVKYADVIDKDAVRSLFNHFKGDQLVEKQHELARLLKSVFKVTKQASYYQGLNDVMGILMLEYGSEECLEIFEGLINYNLR